jgi:hypothetical protein
MNISIEDIIVQFFGSISLIVGHEANYQAALQHHLTRHVRGDVLREHSDNRAGKGGIDVVVRDEKTKEVSMAFEIKGGAQNINNALTNTFNKGGYCSDYKKLEKLNTTTSCWMIAIDALELGRGLPYPTQLEAVETARGYGVGFAYYALGETSATVVHPDGRLMHPTVEPSSGAGTSFERVRSFITSSETIYDQLKIDGYRFGKEADVVGSLYSGLLQHGCSPSQISLETYFGFAPGGEMQERPDICIYEPSIRGHFNLYPNGNNRDSYDQTKLENLRCLIEVKKDSSFKACEKDLDKIMVWREQISRSRRQYDLDTYSTDYAFLAVDQRPKGLSSEMISRLKGKAESNEIIFHHLHSPVALTGM